MHESVSKSVRYAARNGTWGLVVMWKGAGHQREERAMGQVGNHGIFKS